MAGEGKKKIVDIDVGYSQQCILAVLLKHEVLLEKNLIRICKQRKSTRLNSAHSLIHVLLTLFRYEQTRSARLDEVSKAPNTKLLAISRLGKTKPVASYSHLVRKL